MPGSVSHRVPLESLPADIRFPDALRERIAYDPERRQLVFAGSMSKRDFDQLLVLNNDIGYQRALEALFQQCTFAADSKQRFSIGLVQRATRWLRRE